MALSEGITIETANAYFSARLGADGWESASDTDKGKALNTAQEILMEYQACTDAADYEKALYEQTLWLLDGTGEDMENGVTSFSMSGISQSFKLNRPAHMAPRAWLFLKRSRMGPVYLP